MNFVTLQKLYTEYELQGMEEERLNTHFYQQVTQRMATEEATCVLSNAEQAENGWVDVSASKSSIRSFIITEKAPPLW